MIVKRCNNCGEIIPVGKKCKCGLKNRTYSSEKYTEEIRKFYSTAEWKKAREICIERCFGIDLYSYFILQKIEYGTVVHHIIPVVDNYSLRTSQSNLIYLTDDNHRLIHRLYETDFKSTTEMLGGCKQLK